MRGLTEGREGGEEEEEEGDSEGSQATKGKIKHEVGAKFINNTCTVTLLLGFITLYHSRKRKNVYLTLAASLYVLTLQASRHYPNY